MTLPPVARANPSVDQYVESVPTGGAGTDRGGGANPEGRPLPQPVRERLREQGGADAAQLDAVATSPALGAPPSAGRLGSGETPKPSPLDAATTAAVDSGDAPIALLAGGMLALTAVAGAVAFTRRRRAPD